MFELNTFLETKDFDQIKNKGIKESSLARQINKLTSGIPAVNVIQSATIDNSGIKKLTDKTLTQYTELYQSTKEDLSIIKFVPASGAATRMFKNLFEFLLSSDSQMSTIISKLIKNIKNFAFYDELNKILEEQNSSIEAEIKNENYKKIIELIISEKGLNYGNLPKGLIKFHKYENDNRTAFEEHIVESINYASSKNTNKIHFTVSPEHKTKFEDLAKKLTKKYNTINLEIDFSIQAPSTDTIALTPDNKPFRNDDGSILFRPGGHGALIFNLNNINADLIFIKNIDNIVPDRLKTNNCKYKKAIAGILLETQNKSFEFIKFLKNNPSDKTIQTAYKFVSETLAIKIEFEFENLKKAEKIEFLLKKLDRPIRVCAMVKNLGEPGGGPFFVRQNDQTASLQIVEKAQINLSNPEKLKIFDNSTHFNPVDIVFSPKKHNGEKFDLNKFIDKKAGFISEKSKDGRDLKALELPGLWNGAMADWNTIFVEVPIDTFNPVKIISDLLRENHQNN